MPVTVLSAVRRAGVRAANLRVAARALLKVLGETAGELTVVLVDDEEIRDLNREYRGQDRPTDVLAFAMREGRRTAGDECLLGDIVISLDTAARQARRRGRTLEREIRTLFIHGLLHLLGYDHERSPAEARRMRAKERELEKILPHSQPRPVPPRSHSRR